MARNEPEFSEHDLGALIAHEIRHAQDYDQTELSKKRTRALEYHRGEMNDTPARPNGSEITSRDLADTISWMLPGIMRVFMSSDRMAEYEATAPHDNSLQAMQRAEEQAEQASDYVSYVFFKDNPGYKTVYNASYDSLLAGNGVVKHWWDDTPVTETSFHTRLTVEQVAMLTEDEDTEILAQKVNKEPDLVQDPMTGEMTQVETYDVKIERTMQRGKMRCEAIAPENFLIDDTATCVEDARFMAHRDPYMTRSKLIEMGFDREKIDALAADRTIFQGTEESAARREAYSFNDNNMVRSTERIDYYECYIMIDVDGDGIAETCKANYAASAGAGEVLDWEVWEDDIPFSDVPCYPQPHRYDAESVADRTVDIQQIKTVLQRQALDNLYVSNLPMQEVDVGSVINPDILISPKFGGTIWKKPGSQPIKPHVIPFVADKVLLATEYFDRIIEKRTGVSRTMMALDPEALQNQTATANQNARDASYSQTELVARNMAELGWRRVFRAMLKLIVKHQDRPRIIRLRGKFLEMDPRHWNANMDVTVNTGLGTGSRDRDMAMLGVVMQQQIGMLDRLAGSGFAAEAIEMIPRIRETAMKHAEAAGIRNPEVFYPDFDDQHLQQMKEQAAEKAKQPPPEVQIEQMRQQGAQQIEQIKAQSGAQMKQVELQAQMQMEQGKLGLAQKAEELKAQGNQVKEAAQLQADLQVKEAERQNAVMLAGMEMDFNREKLATEAALKREEIESRYNIAALQAGAQLDAAKQRANSQGANGKGASG